MEPVEKAVWFFQSLLGSVPMPMFTFYLVRCYGEDWRRSALFIAVLAIWGLYVLLLCVGQFTALFYSTLHWESRLRQDLRYPSGVIALLAITLLNLISVIRRWGTLPPKKRFAFLTLLLPVPVTIVYLLLCASGLLFTDIGIALSALSMFFIILHDQVEQDMRQQRQIAHQRASLMVLQMRPHYIYNTMMSIYYLCKQDPDMAQQVTLDFTTYLRKNFTALASEAPIPFSEELEHTRAYLAVEQAQFDDLLFIDYDTPHVALENIRERLEIMCGGKMTVTPREGGGTVVRLAIP